VSLEVQHAFERDGSQLELCITPVGTPKPYAALRLVKGNTSTVIGIYSEEIPRLVSELKEAWRRTGGAWRKDDIFARCLAREEAGK
jgi:hypothetical protein